MPSAARPTKSSCPRHVSGNVWARQGCWERAMRFGPDCMPKPKQSGLQVECTKITARARWAFEATGKRICVRIDRHCAPETAPDIAALAMSAGASKIGIAIGMSSSSASLVRCAGRISTRTPRLQQQQLYPTADEPGMGYLGVSFFFELLQLLIVPI